MAMLALKHYFHITREQFMQRLSLILVIIISAILAACTSTPAQPTAQPTVMQQPTRTSQPTITPVNFSTQVFPTAYIPPTSAAPPIVPVVPTQYPANYTPQPSLLNGGRGLTNGAIQNNGEFQVEGYCSTINPNYQIEEDGTRWYCTNNGVRMLAIGTAEFDNICVRTYNNPAAFAMQIEGSQPAIYRWRCFGY